MNFDLTVVGLIVFIILLAWLALCLLYALGMSDRRRR